MPCHAQGGPAASQGPCTSCRLSLGSCSPSGPAAALLWLSWGWALPTGGPPEGARGPWQTMTMKGLCGITGLGGDRKGLAV